VSYKCDLCERLQDLWISSWFALEIATLLGSLAVNRKSGRYSDKCSKRKWRGPPTCLLKSPPASLHESEEIVKSSWTFLCLIPSV
jgi:hypothetical protein